MDSCRINGKRALSTIFSKQKNIEVLEKYIFESLKIPDDESEYNGKMYEIMEFYTGDNVKKTLEFIKTDKFDYGHETFDIIRKKEREHDDFLIKPFEVSEGVLECSKCGSKQTISTSKQTRAGDESTTVFAMCVKCNSTWKI